MRIITMLMFAIVLISLLTGCSSMVGNVVPQKGPTMEDVYDTMPTKAQSICYSKSRHDPYNFVEDNATHRQFHKLSNPELKMYVFPHLAGNDEVPIPGYYTEFNAYEHDHYALPLEHTRFA